MVAEHQYLSIVLIGDVFVYLGTANSIFYLRHMTSLRKGTKGIGNESLMAMPMGLEPTITGETVRRISHYATAPYKIYEVECPKFLI